MFCCGCRRRAPPRRRAAWSPPRTEKPLCYPRRWSAPSAPSPSPTPRCTSCTRAATVTPTPGSATSAASSAATSTTSTPTCWARATNDCLLGGRLITDSVFDDALSRYVCVVRKHFEGHLTLIRFHPLVSAPPNVMSLVCVRRVEVLRVCYAERPPEAVFL